MFFHLLSYPMEDITFLLKTTIKTNTDTPAKTPNHDI